MKSFTYPRNKKHIAKGGYGNVYLTTIPEREIQKGGKKKIQVIKKEFMTKNALGGEIYYFNKLSDAIKSHYFPLFYRAYERQVKLHFINFQEEDLKGHRIDTVYGIDMEYLHPDRWQILRDLFKKDDRLIDHVFRQLIHFQLHLIKEEGGIYYDISSRNIFVCKTTKNIRMVDYGGLFIPDNPQTLLESRRLETRYPKQKFPNPFHNSKITNTTYYDNRYFEGPLIKNENYDVIPALYGIIITVHMCLKAMIRPTDDLSYFEEALKSQKKFITTLLNDPDIVNDWTLCRYRYRYGGGKSDKKTFTLPKEKRKKIH